MMRRPTSIPGLVLHLVRLRVADSPRLARATAFGLAATLALAAPLALRNTPATAPSPHTTMPLAGGHCVATGAFCLADRTCGHGDHCVDSHDLRGFVMRSLAPETRDDALPLSPTIAWGGDGFGIVWSSVDGESADLWFARTNANGQRSGQPVRLTRGTTLKLSPSIAASSDGYAVAWTDLGDDGVTAWLQRIDRNGAARGQAQKLTPPNTIDLLPRVVWNGAEWAVTWYRLESPIDAAVRFARITPDGNRVGEDRTIASKTLPSGPLGFAFMGDAYGLGWSAIDPRNESGQTLFVRIGAGGDATAPFRVSGGAQPNGAVCLAWSGSHFGTVWEDAVSLDEDAPLGRLAFAGVTPTSLAAPRREVTPRDAYHGMPSLAWSGAQYGLAWSRIGGDGADVFFTRLDVRGASVGSPLRLTPGALGIMPAVAWSGSHFAVAWTHLGVRGVQLRLARVDANGRRAGDDVVLAGDAP
jgi:hypothetical protein